MCGYCTRYLYTYIGPYNNEITNEPDKEAYYMIKNSGKSSLVVTFEFKMKNKLIILNVIL